MIRLSIIVLIGFSFGTGAGAAEKDDLAALPSLGTATVGDVQNGMTLTLDDGRVVRLAGIDVPLPLKGSSSWLAREPNSILTALASGKTVTMLGDGTLDRYARIVAHLVRNDGVWFEGALLSAGMSRVRTDLAHRDLAADMLQRETEARNAKRGLWKSAFFAVKTPDDLDHSSGHFELVEGKIIQVDVKGGITILVFDAGDATAEIARSAQKLFPPDQRYHQNLIGKQVRLRGWIAWKGHPILEIDHPEQIEILD